MTFYGQGLVSVEITYRPGVDVSGVTAQSYILEDRGTLSPDFGRIEIAGVSVQGQTVTLSIAENTGATSNNKMIYTRVSRQYVRPRSPVLEGSRMRLWKSLDRAQRIFIALCGVFLVAAVIYTLRAEQEDTPMTNLEFFKSLDYEDGLGVVTGPSTFLTSGPASPPPAG